MIDEPLTRIAVDAVRRAAALCEAVAASLIGPALAKADKSPVTIGDFGSQALVARSLALACPEIPLVAEEGADELRRPEARDLLDRVVRQVRASVPEADAGAVLGWIDRGSAEPGPSGRFWTLDPIDGTKGFLRGDQYAIALALVEDGRVLLGVLACPRLPAPEAGSLFLARKGQGGLRFSLADPRAEPEAVRVSVIDDPAEARLCESVESGHTSRDTSAALARRLGLAGPPIRLDSQAKYALVASGAAEVYLRISPAPDYREWIWDHAAGAILVAEAGGTVLDLDGRPLDFGRGRRLAANRGVVADNGAFHDRLIGPGRA
jgi:HAL2 family 3'(2'),5'-bisphosphate nucleotidase